MPEVAVEKGSKAEIWEYEVRAARQGMNVFLGG